MITPPMMQQLNQQTVAIQEVNKLENLTVKINV